MWEQYKRTFWPVQLFIFGLCATMLFFLKVSLTALGGPLLVMEIGAIYGARWAIRLKGMNGKEVLPLHRSR